MPVEMREMSLEGPWILAETRCSARREAYLRRANSILGFYATMTAYSHQGAMWLNQAAKHHAFREDTPVRVKFTEGRTFQSTYRVFRRMYTRAGTQLTSQALLMVYGNFEAFFAEMILDALRTRGVTDAEDETLRLLATTKWHGKMNRAAANLGFKLTERTLIDRFRNVDMRFFGEKVENPIQMLEAIAEVRHRLVHYSGRVDSALAKAHPKAGLQEGRQIDLPFGLPWDLHWFFALLTEVIDEVYCAEFGWKRELLSPERLTE